MIKAIVTGAGGRMGGRIISLLETACGIKLAGAVERPGHEAAGRDVGEIWPVPKRGVIVAENLKSCIDRGEVIIDFTAPEASLNHLKIAVDHNRALVIGTTGFSPEEIEKMKGLAGRTRCLFSPNMSIGVNVLFKAVELVSGMIGGDYDVEILEIHHNLKKDAPSGTALKLGEIAAKAAGRDLAGTAVLSRQGLIGARRKEEIGIQTLRAGDVVGEHLVMFASSGERLELIHRAHSRDNFAQGAIRAAKWQVGQVNGLYDMSDVLRLKGHGEG